MKILLSAYACSLNLGGEEEVGWNTAVAIAQKHEVWVLTRTYYRPRILETLEREPIPNLHFVYVNPFRPNSERRHRSWWAQLYYYLWQIWAYFKARALHREIGFDLAHHVTHAKYWSPSFISLLPIPFLWGPVGGGEMVPQAFRQDLSDRGRRHECYRDIAHHLGESDPFVHLTVRHADATLATTHETAERLRHLNVRNLRVFSQVGLSSSEIERLGQLPPPPDRPMRFISIGRLLSWKGFHLSLKAFALARIEGAQLWIVGKGSEGTRLQALAEKLDIADRVCFWGYLPREQTLTKLQQCHVLLHPSLHDSGGLVCSEAMATGRPPICLDLGGPGTQVTEETGIKIAATTPDRVVGEIAEAMVRLAKDPQLRDRLGRAGQKRVREVYDWNVKAQFFNGLYRDIVEKHSSRSQIRS
jgi:glycosyltransferase involved in cell wall biosynthesis